MFIDIEQAIVSRLETKLAALDQKPRVYPGAELEHIQDRSQGAASVFVAYNGIVGVDTLPGNASVCKLTLEFLVWIVARSASRKESGQGTRETADPIIVETLQSLAGWRPIEGAAQLVPSDSPGQVYADGFGYFPVAFRITQQIRGNPT